MDNLRELVLSSHIQAHYPNAHVDVWDSPDCKMDFYTAEELQNFSGDWFPLCCHIDPATGKLVYGGRSRISHTYTEGETGAGKTSRFAMQSIRALSCKADRPSFLVVDIHGELLENLYPHLIKNGYAVKVLNCDDPNRSDTYNPFSEMVERCQKTGKLDHEVISAIRKIAEIVQPVVDTDDPIWEQGARAYTNGAILDKFEDLLNGDIPPECITLYNIIQNHYWLRNTMQSRSIGGNILSIPHYHRKGTDALSVQKMLAVTNNAEKTRASYFGVIENHYDAFGQPSLYKLCSNSTIDVRDFIENPTAVFIQSGSTSIGDHLIALMVNEIYNTVVRMGRESATKLLKRRIHCFLDEFANSSIADGPEFIKMLTTSRKFGMHWHILLQCDAQLDRKFDPNIARIVRANCTELFMGSNDHETMVRFAKSCGTKTVESLGSQVSGQAPVLTTVDLITPDRLNLLPEGHLYIKTNRHPLLLSYIEAFYKCDEFQPVTDIHSVYPVNDFDYRDTVFYPDDIPPRLSDAEFQLLRHIYKNDRADVWELEEQFPTLDTDAICRRLVDLKLLSEDEERDQVVCQTGKEQLEAIAKRHPNVPELVPAPKEEDAQDPAAEGGQSLHALNGNLVNAIEQQIKVLKPSELTLRRTLNDFTCLPATLVNTYNYFAGYYPAGKKDARNLQPKLLRFEILEKFIASNDFATKEEWIEKLRGEYTHAVIVPLFPRELTVVIAAALKELKDELTLENIREIKRIISG